MMLKRRKRKRFNNIRRNIIRLELETGVGLSTDSIDWIKSQPRKTKDEGFVYTGLWWCYACDGWHQAEGAGFRKVCSRVDRETRREID